MRGHQHNTSLVLEHKYYDTILQILNNHIQGEVWAYGSRIKGNYHSGSDLDLLIVESQDKSKLDLCRLAFQESNIPFIIDIHLKEDLPQYMIEEIEKFYVVIK